MCDHMLSARSVSAGVEVTSMIAMLTALARVSDTWVESGVKQVNQKIDEHGDKRDKHHQILHDRIVAPAYSLDQEARHARDVEDCFGDDQSSHQECCFEPDDGHDR